MTAPGSDTDFRLSHVSTVPVFWADLPGPTRAALMFNVGWADETLPQHGITHMLEHLAFADLGRSQHQCNGATAETVTSFTTQGTVEQATAFLSAISKGLANPDTSRLDEEKRILRIEENRRRAGATGRLRIWRFGTSGPGLGSYDEFARFYTEGQHLASWSAKYFTAGNAAVVMTSPPPPDWQLHLHPGIPHRRGAWSSPLPSLPARVVEPINGVILSMLVPRNAAASALEYVLYHRLMNRLRFEEALTYGVTIDTLPVDSTTSELFVLSDSLPEHQADLERGLLSVLAEVRRAGPTDAELDEWRTGYCASVAAEEARADLLFRAGQDHIQGLRPRQAAEWLDDAVAVTADDVRALLAQASQTVLAATPGTFGSPLTTSLAEATSPYLTMIVPPSKRAKRNVLADRDTVTLEDPAYRLTIPWAQCAGVLRWYDGGRTILATDGSAIDLRPSDWKDLESVTTVIDRFTPPETVIWTGEASEPESGEPAKEKRKRVKLKR